MDLHSKNLLSQSFCDSLNTEIIGSLSGIAEVGLDRIFEDGVVKDIPLISTAVSLYRIGHSVHDRHSLKKLAVFLDGINQGAQDDKLRQKYVMKFQENPKFHNQQLEFVLILLDRYVGYDKPQMLAKLYLSYLNEDSTLDEFSIYAEIIDRFLPGDAELLCSEGPQRKSLEKQRADSLARLVSLGLMREYTKWRTLGGGPGKIPAIKLPDGNEKECGITNFGERLASILR